MRLRPRITLLAGAVAVYAALATALIGTSPGPHYDEALFQAGAVQMLTSREAPSFTHPAHGWLRAGGRFWPVMTMPYAGAASFYLLLPVFALFGPSVVAGRVLAAFLGAFGLWGTGRLCTAAAGAGAAAAVVVILAVHPGYLSNTVFNDSGFAYWMAGFAAACIAVHRYLDRSTVGWAALVGLACGLGLWTRLNFAWLLAAAGLGALAGFGRRAIPPVAHLAAAAVGVLLGGLPLAIYQAVTRAHGTLEYMASVGAQARNAAHFAWRLRLLSSALVYDEEHRVGMWQGPALPPWQVTFTAVVICAALVGALAPGGVERARRWHRATAVSTIAFALVMIWTRLPVRAHHLLALAPFAAALVVLAAVRLVAWRRAGRPALAALAAVYLAVALHWDWSAWGGIRRTGGTGYWSDATVSVARYLEARGGRRPLVFDWGFDTSILVLTEGRVRTREMFWRDPRGPDAPVWRRVIVPGGVYLTHAAPYLTPMGAAATARFEQALTRSPLTRSTVVFRDRLGRPHTELVEVSP